MGTLRDGRSAADSWYARTAAPFPRQPALEGDVRCDVAILGAGLTGLSTAIELARAGRKVVVLEARSVGWGASGRNGGQAIFGFGCDQHRITRELGLADSRKLFDWSREGLDLLRSRIREFAIDCDWVDGHAHVPIRERQVRELKAWQDDLATNFDYPLEWWSRAQLRAVLASDRYRGALYDRNSGHLHPLNYTLGLARAALALGVTIHEQTEVEALERGSVARLRTAKGTVHADAVVLAGNAYVHGIAPELDVRIMPVGTYIGATTPLGPERAAALIGNGMAVADVNWALDYFRLSSDHRLLFGGRASYSTLKPLNLAGIMASRMRRVFPQLADVRFEQVWGGYVDISLSRAPHWGRITPNIYFAQGFSGHGVVATGLAGQVIAEAILMQSNRLDVFERLTHHPFPGGRLLRTPMLVAAMAWFKLRDALW